MNNLKQKTNKEIKRIFKYFGLAIFGFFVLCYIVTWNDTHVNLDIVLTKNTFEEKDFYIVEVLNEYGKIESKGIKQKPFSLFSKTYQCSVKLESIDTSISKRITKEEYENYEIGQEILLTRKVYYTKTGLRLFYKDKITKYQYKH